MKKQIVAVVLISLLLTGCGSKLYEGTSRGYDDIREVPGIAFDVPDGLEDFATAVSSISDSMGFERQNTYVYKDLNGKYFLFCMDTIVVAAQKGSNFHLNEADNYEEAIQSTDLFGIWFTKTGKSLSYDVKKSGSEYKLIADVNASVSLTRDLFDDYRGKLVIIGDGEEEWAVYIGILASEYDDADKSTLSGLEHMAKSIRLTAETNTAEEQLVEAGYFEESNEEEDGENEEVSKEEEIKETENLPEKVKESPKQTGVDTQESDSTSKESLQEETVHGEPDRETESERRDSITLSNQKIGKKRDNAAYSTIYSTLSLGESAYADVFSKDTLDAKEVVVTVKAYYDGGEATTLLKKILGESFVPAGAGTTWNVVEYDVDYPDDERPYLNALFTGMDGNNLRLRGIKYSKRTKQLSYDDKHYLYYEVPNGCSQYLIKFGDCPGPEMKSAYFQFDLEEKDEQNKEEKD